MLIKIVSYVQDLSNKMFILLYFKKKVGFLSVGVKVFRLVRLMLIQKITTSLILQEEQNIKKQIEWPELKPCIYKRR